MKTVISVLIVFVATTNWTSGRPVEGENVEANYELAVTEYKNAVINLASDKAIGRSKDHFIASQQSRMLRLKDSILLYEKKR